MAGFEQFRQSGRRLTRPLLCSRDEHLEADDGRPPLRGVQGNRRFSRKEEVSDGTRTHDRLDHTWGPPDD